jgi:transcriptional regulator with GAF, ATPase, and Fis domain
MGDTVAVIEYGSQQARYRERAKLLASSAVPILIAGETGAGKEILAREIHTLSGKSGAFIAVNCACLPTELVASELFGHVRGAFSNASQSRSGLFRAAQDGTILLDELGDLPLALQPALLRVVQERTVRPVGSDREVDINARILGATHVDLSAAVKAGRFREDLYARIANCIVYVPPLRERRSELLGLAASFAREAGCEFNATTDAVESLLVWRWPMNIRELRGIIESHCAESRGNAPLTRDFIQAFRPQMILREGETPPLSRERGAKNRREHLRELLIREKGNVSAVARALGKPRSQIYRWLRQYSLSASIDYMEDLER